MEGWTDNGQMYYISAMNAASAINALLLNEDKSFKECSGFTCVNNICGSVVQSDPPPLTALEMLLNLWGTISIVIYAGSAFLVVCLLIVIVIYAVNRKYVQPIACQIF